MWHLTDNIVQGPTSDSSNNGVIWASVVRSVFADFFLFSMFFVPWNWSVRHFRAHWHNFILNAYRHRALHVLNKMENEKPDESDRQELRKFTALLLLFTGDTAYLEHEEGKTLAEKLIKFEDLLRDLISGTKKP